MISKEWVFPRYPSGGTARTKNAPLAGGTNGICLLLRAFQRERTDINTLHSRPIFAQRSADRPVENRSDSPRPNAPLFASRAGVVLVLGSGEGGLPPGGLLSYRINRAAAQMAEEDKQRQITAPDSPGSGRSRTGRAVALARLLHHECTRLLQLYVSLVFAGC